MPGFENTLTIHPLFVHFPIALTLVALLFEGWYWVQRKDHLRQSATSLIYLAALAAVVTVLTGLQAADSLGHDSPGHDLVHVHRDIMLWYTGIMAVLALVNVALARGYLPSVAAHWRRLGRPVLLLTAAIVLVVGADRGGQLVFQYGTGVNLESTATPETGQGHEEEQMVPTTDAVPAGHEDHDHEH